MTPKQKLRQEEVLTVAHHNYKRGLSLHALGKIHNRATSEDLVQDTFMKTWNYLAKGGKIEIMKAFLYHVLNDLIVDEYRKRKTLSLDILIEEGYEPSGDSTEHLFTILDGRTAVVLITHLPKKYQRVMRMRYVQDLSLTEIALATGESKNTLAVQLHRGLEKLKLFIGDSPDTEYY